MISTFNLFLLIAVFITILVAASTMPVVVDAAIPSNFVCKCENGAVRDTSVDHCACTGCNSPYVLPYCSFQGTEQIQFAITYNWTLGKDLFPFDTAENNIKNQLGTASGDFSRLRRMPSFEGENEIVVGYLMKGSFANTLYTDVFATTKPTYLSSPKALNMWQLGTVVSPPGIFSKHFGTGNILANVNIAGGTMRINDRQLEFIITALVIAIGLPIIDAVISCATRPTAEELDEQEVKYGNENDKTKKISSSADADWEMTTKKETPKPTIHTANNHLFAVGSVTTTTATTQPPQDNNYYNPLHSSGASGDDSHHGSYDKNSNSKHVDEIHYGDTVDVFSSPPPAVPMHDESHNHNHTHDQEEMPHHSQQNGGGGVELTESARASLGPLRGEEVLAPVPPPPGSFRRL